MYLHARNRVENDSNIIDNIIVCCIFSVYFITNLPFVSYVFYNIKYRIKYNLLDILSSKRVTSKGLNTYTSCTLLTSIRKENIRRTYRWCT